MNTCTTCQYFSNSSCHRYPPKAVSYTESERKGSNGEYHDEIETYTNSEHPSVTAADWCGEWADKNSTH